MVAPTFLAGRIQFLPENQSLLPTLPAPQKGTALYRGLASAVKTS